MANNDIIAGAGANKETHSERQLSAICLKLVFWKYKTMIWAVWIDIGHFMALGAARLFQWVGLCQSVKLWHFLKYETFGGGGLDPLSLWNFEERLYTKFLRISLLSRKVLVICRTLVCPVSWEWSRWLESSGQFVLPWSLTLSWLADRVPENQDVFGHGTWNFPGQPTRSQKTRHAVRHYLF